MTLSLQKAAADTVRVYCLQHAPLEACGLVVSDGGGQRVIVMANVERSETLYRFDPQEQLKVWHEIEDSDERIVAIFHSHTATTAQPSSTDLVYAADPGVSQLICSTSHDQLRSWRVVDGQATEEPIELV